MTARVVAVGAGPAGAAVALLLARAGVAVRVVERETSFACVFRGEGLMRLGSTPCRGWAWGRRWPRCRSGSCARGASGSTASRRSSSREPVAELSERAVRPSHSPRCWSGWSPRASGTCRARSSQAPGSSPWRGPDSRVTGVRLATAGRERDLPADLVIECDGRGSLVRARAGLQLEPSRERCDVLWLTLPAPAALAEGCAFMIMAAAGGDPAVCRTSWDARPLGRRRWAQRAWPRRQHDPRFGSTTVQLHH
ncbi:MAG: FAD-dependent monooxygenase [Egibacteraceae bacterium]